MAHAVYDDRGERGSTVAVWDDIYSKQLLLYIYLRKIILNQWCTTHYFRVKRLPGRY